MHMHKKMKHKQQHPGRASRSCGDCCSRADNSVPRAHHRRDLLTRPPLIGHMRYKYLNPTFAIQIVPRESREGAARTTTPFDVCTLFDDHACVECPFR